MEIAKQKGETAQRRLWEQARRGELTVKEARRQKSPASAASGRKMASAAASGTSASTFRYPIQTDEAIVTVVFAEPRPSLDQIVAALEQALEGEKARQASQS